MMHRVLSLCGLLACGLPLSAQIPLTPALGPFSTTGLGFVVPGPGRDLQHYRPDDQQVYSFEPLAGAPHFAVAEIFAGIDPGLLPLVELDAISTGNDLIPVSFTATDARIVQWMAPVTWTALFVSFAAGSVAPTDPEPMRSRAASGGAGADVFSWITPGSVPLGAFEDRVFLDVRAELLGLGASEELSALDIPMALMAQGRGQPDALFSPHRNWFFFSLTQASAELLTAQFPGVADVDMSGGTVFASHWNGSSWNLPVVVKSANNLGLGGDSSISREDDVELDALAVDATWIEPLVVFSVVGSAPMPQLQATRGLYGPFELRDQNGNSASARFGDTDVDAICGVDPEMGHFSRWFGTAAAPFGLPPLNLSATQMFDRSGAQLNLVCEIHAPGAVSSDAELAPGITALVVGDAAVPWPDWQLVWLNLDWSGFGTLRCHLPIASPAGVNVQFLAAHLPAAGSMALSSVVFLRL